MVILFPKKISFWKIGPIRTKKSGYDLAKMDYMFVQKNLYEVCVHTFSYKDCVHESSHIIYPSIFEKNLFDDDLF